MGADALAALGLLLAGIADQFDMLVGFLAVEPVKGILRELQGFGKGAQQADAHLGHLLLPVK
jgi:Na+-translocating ferredoxin:NAD+ oxidoreductase RnfE subunit